MGRKANPYSGKWRIIEMEMWDQNFIDLVTEGHFTFDNDDSGNFQFGAVEGQIDYRIEDIREAERLEFSWEGSDDMNPVSGRGWATLEGGEINGKIYFHMGDSSWFKAKRS